MVKKVSRRAWAAAFAAAALLFTAPASAHEYWLWPSSFDTGAGLRLNLAQRVGEYFEGETVGFSAARVASLRRLSAQGSADLASSLPVAQALPVLPLVLPGPGTHVIALDSQPSEVTLSADRFHAYLHDEGLDAVIQDRTRRGQASTPGRERYRRHVKTLVQAGGQADGAALQSSGQKLEILPQTDPLLMKAGDTLAVRVLFDGKPLAGALVKAWHRHEGQLLMLRVRSAADGSAPLTLPYAGPWMVSVVHMIAAPGGEKVDWDSFWGNLTFALR